MDDLNFLLHNRKKMNFSRFSSKSYSLHLAAVKAKLFSFLSKDLFYKNFQHLTFLYYLIQVGKLSENLLSDLFGSKLLPFYYVILY